MEYILDFVEICGIQFGCFLNVLNQCWMFFDNFEMHVGCFLFEMFGIHFGVFLRCLE